MRSSLETRLGVFFALAFIAGAIVLELAGGFDFFKRGLVLKARFPSVLELKVGDPVKMAGKEIGRVEDIQFAGDRVLVTMKILDRTATIRTDSRATIKFSGLLGQNYVSIDFGTPAGRPIEIDGQEIQTYEQADFGTLLSKLDEVASDLKKITANFADLHLDELIAPFSDFLTESRPRIMGILTNAEAVSEQIASGKGTVGKLIFDDSLYTTALQTVTNLDSTAAEIKATASDARAVIADVRSGKGTIGKLATDDQLYRELADASTSLKEILQKINRGQGSVGKLVNDETLINNARLTLQKLDKATEGLEDQGPLTVISILANPLF
ncbi:MAG: MlaD family protein [Verrucomicrobiae bacterium]|nr:MlaD family protein [Verrucomicrobiae bacterium]